MKISLFKSNSFPFLPGAFDYNQRVYFIHDAPFARMSSAKKFVHGTDRSPQSASHFQKRGHRGKAPNRPAPQMGSSHSNPDRRRIPRDRRQ
jgi:hypothetical protein